MTYLKQLNVLVKSLIKMPAVKEEISDLKSKLPETEDAFVWSVIDSHISTTLPGNIKSAWIFVLKKGIPSGCHYHPNSIQHMVLIEGSGVSKVNGKIKKMIPLGSVGFNVEDIWYVIKEGEEHEFFPEGQDMVVISFHTCLAGELQEISCRSDKKRLYT